MLLARMLLYNVNRNCHTVFPELSTVGLPVFYLISSMLMVMPCDLATVNRMDKVQDGAPQIVFSGNARLQELIATSHQRPTTGLMVPGRNLEVMVIGKAPMSKSGQEACTTRNWQIGWVTTF